MENNIKANNVVNTSNVEDIELINAFNNGDRDAYDQLVMKHQGLIGHVAKSIKGYNDFEDLYSQGEVALMEAIVNYDVNNSKASFATYAATCIKNELVKYANRNHGQVSLPDKKQAMVGRYNKACEQLTAKLGRKPSDDELNEVGFTNDDLNEVRSYMFSYMSLDETVGEDEESTYGDFMCSDSYDSFNDHLEYSEKHVLLNEAMNTLNYEEKEFMYLMGKLDSYVDVAKYYNKTPNAMRQRHQKIIAKLKDYCDERYY